MPETPEIIRKRKRNMARNENFRTSLNAGFRGSIFSGGGGAESTPAAVAAVWAGGAGGSISGSGAGQLSLDSEEEGAGEEGLVPLDGLIRRWPGRREQIEELALLIGEGDDGVPVPPILVTGPPCCGKTEVVRALLDHRICCYVYVNCCEVLSKRGVMEAVLEQVAGGSRESILEARRISRRFGEAQSDAANFVEEGDWLPQNDQEEPAAANPEAEEVLEDGGEPGHQEGSRLRLSCSSWNVFFRQLAALLACRSQQHQRRQQRQQQQLQLQQQRHQKHRQQQQLQLQQQQLQRHQQQQQQVQPLRAEGTETGAIVTDHAATTNTNPATTALTTNTDTTADTTTATATTSRCGNDFPSFPQKLFLVFDNAEALLGEATSGVGVGAGGGGSFRGAALVDRLARLSDMMAAYTGFAAAGGGIGGSDIRGSSDTTTVDDGSGTFRPGSGTIGCGSSGIGGDGGTAATPSPPPPPGSLLPSLPPVCPILISKNIFFASEIMSGGGGGGGGRGGGGGGGGSGGSVAGMRSLVARACPLQLRFPPYGPKDLPDVMTATADAFGVDLTIDLSNINFNLNLGGGRGEGGSALSRGGEEDGDGGMKSRKLFRKLAVALVQGLRNETSDLWELGKEAARLWPEYLKMAKDGFEESEMVAGLKPLLRETAKRLNGNEDSRGGSAGGGGGAAAPVSTLRQRAEAETQAGIGGHGLDLSRNGKTLLVAAYLASHNSRETDRDVFTAKSTRRGNSKRTGATVGNAGNQVEAGVKDLPEAREFQLERLLSIVSSLVAVTSTTNAGTKAAHSMGSADMFHQITSLTRLNLIRECGLGQKTIDLNLPTYRCNISRELAQRVAGEIGIDLSQYLVAI